MSVKTILKQNRLETNKIMDIKDYFNQLDFDESWSFKGCTQKDTKYITHGYHRYPAKFIPQIASRLIKELTELGDFVCDPFMGSGTTLVEAKISDRPSVGVDINPVACLISKAKVTAIDPKVIHESFDKLLLNLPISQNNKLRLPFSINEESTTYVINYKFSGSAHERIDYWFKPETKKELEIIYSEIKKIKNKDVQTFFLCGFSHILKNCSIWLAKSNKPTRDFRKIIPDPYKTFLRHIKFMVKKNKDFWNILQSNDTMDTKAKPVCGDTIEIPVEDNSVSLVVTSPPYVTSYEYADLHQLSAIWFGYTDDLAEFRKGFIGSAHNDTEEIEIGSELGKEIVDELMFRDKSKSKEVKVYFSEMRQSFMEMKRYLKKGGKACIVIGDTSFKGVPVLNAEVFVEQMQDIGFRIYEIIKRLIPSKILPQTRDPETGQFTSSANSKKILAYPYEYIIIMERL